MKLKLSFITNSSSSSFAAFVVDRDLIGNFMKDEQKLRIFQERKNDYEEYAKKNDYYKGIYKELCDLATDEEKLEWVDDNIDLDDYYNSLVKGFYSQRGIETEGNYFAIDVYSIAKNYPEMKFSEAEIELAKIVNKELGTNLEKFSFTVEAGYEG